MKLTEQNKMSDFKKLGHIIGLDKAFLEKIKSFSVTDKICDIYIKKNVQISIQHILQAWNLKGNEQLLGLTARSFGLDENNIDEYPLIDFIRLTIELQETASKAAELFMSLKREPKDKEIAGVLEKFTTASDLSIIDRFVTRCKGAYTHDTASDISWVVVYEAFKLDTIEYDKQIATNEIMEKRAKNGNK